MRPLNEAGLPWPLLTVAAVAVAGLVAAAVRRAAAAARGSDIEAHHVAMLGVGLGALALASYGVVTFLLATGFPAALAAAGTIAFEGGMLGAEWSAWASVRHRRPAAIARLYRRAAWACVAASATANALHSPVAGALGTALFAAMPVLGAALVEVVERDLLHRHAAETTDIPGPPRVGPGRVVAAAWRRAWAAAAVRVGATVDTDLADLAQRTRADRAARAMVRLTRARQRRTPRWWRDRLERRAAAAMTRAGVGTDYRQGARMAAQLHLWVTTRELAVPELWRDVDHATARVVDAASIPHRAERVAESTLRVEVDSPERVDLKSRSTRSIASTSTVPVDLRESTRWTRSSRPRPRSTRPVDLDELRERLAEAIEAGQIDPRTGTPINPASAESIRRTLGIGSAAARQLRRINGHP